MNTFKWTLKCQDGTHTVILQQLGSPREPMQLYVDGEKTELQKSKKSIFVNIKHEFTCGEETALLLVYGNQADLVFQGTLQTAKKKYDFKNKIPLAVVLLIMLINLPAMIVSGWETMSVIMTVASTLLIYLFSITPFSSRKEKIMKFVLFTVLNWLIAMMTYFTF